MNSPRKLNGRRLAAAEREDADAAAVAGLSELVGAELEWALGSEPRLVEEVDPGRVLLLWFAVGATAAICQLTDRNTDVQRDALFRTVVARIFDGRGIRSDLDPGHVDHRLIDLSEAAGAEAVAACMRGDPRLGYYLEALQVGRGSTQA